MGLLQEAAVCDCHSHVFGPYERFPLSEERTFDPPESPIEALESVWRSLGIERAVLVQGSAHAQDPGALLAAIARRPEARRGVALLGPDVSESRLAELHRGGIRAVRFNWISRLLGRKPRSEKERLTDAGRLSEKIAAFGWHVEVHLHAVDLHLIEALQVPEGMPVVLDHMALVDCSASELSKEAQRLLCLLRSEKFWVKLSGTDRITAKLDHLAQAIPLIRAIVAAAPDRCVWGLDWPHVNLERKQADRDLVSLLGDALEDESELMQVLVRNPERLYGFAPQAVH